MTLPVASNPISLSQVNVELTFAATATITMNDSALRTLFGVGGAGTMVSMSSGWGKSNGRAKGYFAGGISGLDGLVSNTFGTYYNPSKEIDGINYSTETAINPSAVLAVARHSFGSVCSETKGYFGGGDDVGNGYGFSVEIDGIIFSTEAAINPVAVLATGRHYNTGVSSLSTAKGYFGGGYGLGNSAEIDGINFSTEAAINPAAVLAVARYGPAGVNSSTKGYFCGGVTTASVTEIDGIIFSTEAAINPAAVLAVARYNAAGVSSTTKGYVCGGSTNTTTSAEIDGIDFSTEAAINPVAVLAVARYGPAGVSSLVTSKGYVAGGYGLSHSAEIDGINFSTEAAINPAAVLAVARGGIGGV